MKERPILFSGPMVNAILAGHKTQTRRVMKLKFNDSFSHMDANLPAAYDEIIEFREQNGTWFGLHGWNQLCQSICPYGLPGDRLWVRETWAETDTPDGTPVVAYKAGGCVAIGRECQDGPDALIHSYAWADTPHVEQWRPSIFMPRWASRIHLEVTAVRVERLQDISESDCWAEGIEEVMHNFDSTEQIAMANRLGCCIEDAKPLYALLWEQINGPGSWDVNPWVWGIEFKHLQLA